MSVLGVVVVHDAFRMQTGLQKGEQNVVTIGRQTVEFKASQRQCRQGESVVLLLATSSSATSLVGADGCRRRRDGSARVDDQNIVDWNTVLCDNGRNASIAVASPAAVSAIG